MLRPPVFRPASAGGAAADEKRGWIVALRPKTDEGRRSAATDKIDTRARERTVSGKRERVHIWTAGEGRVGPSAANEVRATKPTDRGPRKGKTL